MRESTQQSGVSTQLGGSVQHPFAISLPLTRAATLRDCQLVLAQRCEYFNEAAAVRRVRDQQLYLVSFSSFNRYFRERSDISRLYGDQKIRTAEIRMVLTPIGVTPLPANEAQIRPLKGLSDGQIVAAWRRVVEETAHRTVPSTGALVSKAVRGLMPFESATLMEAKIRSLLKTISTALRERHLPRALEATSVKSARLRAEIFKSGFRNIRISTAPRHSVML
jgi:hypothetical protein